MSGGFFEYRQHQIRNIWEYLENQLDRQGRERTKEEMVFSKDYYEDYPEEKFHITFPEGVQDVMKRAIECLKTAEIYTQRLDWYLSGDDGEQTLYERLKEDLQKLNKINNYGQHV